MTVLKVFISKKKPAKEWTYGWLKITWFVQTF
jgi:hypothetical protein